jgi:hypothetical protein
LPWNWKIGNRGNARNRANISELGGERDGGGGGGRNGSGGGGGDGHGGRDGGVGGGGAGGGEASAIHAHSHGLFGVDKIDNTALIVWVGLLMGEQSTRTFRWDFLKFRKTSDFRISRSIDVF